MHGAEPRGVATPSGPLEWSAPPECLLCGTVVFTLKFPARQPARSLDARAYRCTSNSHRHHRPIWACPRCGVLTQWPQPEPAQLALAYSEVEDPLYVAERENRYLTFRRVAKRLGSAEGRRLLDVGAYCGYFVDVAQDAGFAAEGLELSEWACEQARALGLTIHNETLASRAESDARYDIVTMWDVVEHLHDPRTELSHVHRLLPPGGQLYLSTIDSGSALARLLGRRWPWLMEMHLFYFDRESITALLQQAGFQVVSITHYTHVISARYLMEKATASYPLLAVRSPRRSSSA